MNAKTSLASNILLDFMQLQKLRDVSFLLEEQDMLDVHREFAKGFTRMSTARKSNPFLYVERQELRGSDLHRIITQNLNRVAFVECTFHKLKTDLDLSSCNDIRVLLLDKNKGLNSVILSPNCLQSLDIRSATPPLLVRGAGNFLLNQWFPFSNFKCMAILQLGGIEGTMWKLDVAQLTHCVSLEVIHLYNVDILTLELSSWTNLKELKLSCLPNLEVLSGFEHLSSLRKLHLFRLNALRSLPDVLSFGKLKALAIASCEILSELKLPGSLKHCSIEECDNLRKIDIIDISDLVRSDKEQNESESCFSNEADSSDDDENSDSENRFIINDCGNLCDINGLVELTSVHSFFYSAPEKGQLSNLQDLDFRHASLGISCRISYFEFHGNPSIWGLHGLALEQVKRSGPVQELGELLQDAVGLKYLRIVCANLGLCSCDANPPSFHLLPSVQKLEYHCSNVADLSTLEQCSSLRILHLDGCINVATWPDFSKLLSLSELHAPLVSWSQCSWNQASGLHLNLCSGCRDMRIPEEEVKLWRGKVNIVLQRSVSQRRSVAHCCTFKYVSKAVYSYSESVGIETVLFFLVY